MSDEKRPSPTPQPRRGLLRRRKDADTSPKEPFFKDAKILHGRVRLDVSLRALLLAMIAFVAVVAFGSVYFIDQNQKLNTAVSDLRTLRKNGHDDRLRAEQEIRDQVRSVACFFWNYIVVSDNPGLQQIATQLDATYHCRNLHLAPPKSNNGGAGGKSTRTPTPGPRLVPTRSATNSAPRSSTNAAAVVPHASSAPRASRSPTPSTAPRTAPATTVTAVPKPKSTGIVDLQPILCTLKLSNC